MKPLCRIVFLITFLANSSVKAQEIHGDVEGLWIIGTSMHVSDKTNLFVYGARDIKLDANAVMVMSAIQLNKYISIAAAYAFISAPPVASLRYQEHSLFGSVLFSLPVKSFLLDDRNMMQEGFRRIFRDLTFYRNRLRLTYATKIGEKKRPFRIFVYDEGYYNITRGMWARNRWSGGAGIRLFDFLESELAYIRETSRNNVNRDLLSISLVVTLDGVLKKVNTANAN